MCHCLHLLSKPKLLICSVSASELIKSVVNTTYRLSVPATAEKRERTQTVDSMIYLPNDAVNFSDKIAVDQGSTSPVCRESFWQRALSVMTF